MRSFTVLTSKARSMPVSYITISEQVEDLTSEQLQGIRDIIAEGLNSRARFLDRHHIVTRVLRSQREHMLGEIEIDIFAQFFWQRLFSRDRRAMEISRRVSNLVKHDCATWINMSIVGYSRVTTSGESFFSD